MAPPTPAKRPSKGNQAAAKEVRVGRHHTLQIYTAR